MMRSVAGTLALCCCVFPEDGITEVGAVAVIRPCLADPGAHEPATDGSGQQHLDHLPPGYRPSECLDEIIESLIFHRLVLPVPI
jgi:hypothetical protein